MSLAGSVILIPLEGEECQVVHVLFELAAVKDVGLIGVPATAEDPDETECSNGYVDYFWVGLSPIRQNKWRTLGRFELPDVTYYTRCILGGWVCENEQELRPAREEDYAKIPRYQPHPRLAAETRLRKLHNKAEHATSACPQRYMLESAAWMQS